MEDLEKLRVAHVYSIDDDAVRKQREEDAYWGDEFDETAYRGLNPETITSLLDKIGARGDSPIMARILYQAGIEKPKYAFSSLYGEYSEYTDGDSRAVLFGVYIDGDSLQRDTTPDALLLAIGFNRKAYRGYKLVMTDLWVNPESPAAVSAERALRDEAQIAMLSGDRYSDYIFVEQSTVIYEIGEEEGKTVEARGIQPEDYGGREPKMAEFDRMAKLGDISADRENSQLLKNFQELYTALKPEVEALGGEGEELYELRLNESEIMALNKLQGFEGTDQITGLSIDREDRPKGRFYYHDKEDFDPYYSNGWGDMTVVVNVEREGVATSYTLFIFMEGSGGSYLHKRTIGAEKFSNRVSKVASHLLALMEDPMDEAMKLNEIDEFEYQSLFKLIRNVQAVTTLT